MLHGKCRFVEPGLPRGVDRHVDDSAHAKTQQDSLFYPSVHAPSGFRGTVWFGRANLTRVQRLLEALEKIKMFVAVCFWFIVEETFDLSLHARSGQPLD